MTHTFEDVRKEIENTDSDWIVVFVDEYEGSYEAKVDVYLRGTFSATTFTLFVDSSQKTVYEEARETFALLKTFHPNVSTYKTAQQYVQAVL
ncbi:hypothetical protein IMZ31_22345 (plasmid) [Pontibacillus sp. ALD_SL1]|uniref:hypothetical protein n=1 Tax=Pontibacillus sp. ALD_SL1 TaxID=2777185 RepID=UPI001A9789EC|nr:hypothetical protein [Pontibacillus sp. ALD_SL1]QST02196.1 hypothetical protein IMZ31_22345 [Pontibacillus sp. ALD_SL1]